MRDRWTDEEYNEVLAFVEKHLWLFVQENAAVHRPQHVVCNLAQLSHQDLRLLQRIYFLLSYPVQRCIREATPSLLRHLTQSTERATTQIKGNVRGNIDWNRTLKRRLGTGFSDPTIFITRIATKRYDLPEMQALKYLLTQVNRLTSELLGTKLQEEEALRYEPDAKWKDNIRSLNQLTNNYLEHASLRDVSLQIKITDLMLQRVRCARNANFKDVYESLRLYRKLFVQEEKEALRECFADGVLKPLSRDTLYEVYILLLTLGSLKRVGWNQEHLRLLGYGKGAVAHYRFDDTILRVYYQSLPSAFAEYSLYRDLLSKYQISTSLRRPDLCLEFEGKASHFTLIEVKRTQNQQYIVDSVYKVFGYLKDFEKCFERKPLPHGLLVVWEGVTNAEDSKDALAILTRKNYQRFLEEALIATDRFQ